MALADMSAQCLDAPYVPAQESLKGTAMREDPSAAELLEIGASSLPLLQRAHSLLESLDHWLPAEATWLALSDPRSTVHTTVGSTGLGKSALDYLGRPSLSREIQLAELKRDRPPVSLAKLPIATEELSAWAECLLPVGFRDGLGVPLFEPGGLYLGMLTVLFTSGEPPSGALRTRLHRLAPLIARGVSPVRSLLATARLVQGATSGVVLLRDGTTYPLPGLEDHELLLADSPVVDIARQALLAGQVYRSFMWATPDGGSVGHARMTVLAATDVPAFVLGTLLVTPECDCRGLTPRELEVLGLLVDGCSNQQIASRLDIALRTVAVHVEHILHKLGVATRTLAAVLGEREGCYVPPSAVPRPRR